CVCCCSASASTGSQESPIRSGALPFLNRIAPAVVFVVLVESPLARSDLRERLDEEDGLHPLHLLEAQLELVAKTNRRAMELWQRLTVHLVRENGLRMAHVPDFVDVVVKPTARIGSVREGDEHGEPGLGFRTDDIQNILHRNPAPLRN